MSRKQNGTRASKVNQQIQRRRSRLQAQGATQSPLMERCEDRLLLTTTVFLDFGFNFPVGGLIVTDAQMADPGVNGPGKFGAGHTLISLTDSVINRSIDLNADGLFDVADSQIFASRIMEVVQRTYQPFDVLVLPAAANNINDVIATLGLNGNGVGNRDAYSFVVGDSPPPPNDSWGWSPVDVGNTEDNTCFTFADAMIAGLAQASWFTGLGRTAAHEPGHSFGLGHTSASVIQGIGDLEGAPDTAPVGPDMRDFGLQHITTRYDLTVQNGGSTQNAYNILAAAGVVGLAPDAPAYVTGTGAHDRITITRASTTDANVLVETYNDAAMTSFINSATYTVDYTNGILVEGSANDDTIIVDADIMQNIEVRGGGGNDRLQIIGAGTFMPTGRFDAVTYTATGGDAGVVDFGGFAVNFREVEPLVLSLTAGTLTINVGDDLGQTVAIRDDATANDGISEVVLGGGLESVSFATPNALVVNTFGGADTITLQVLDQTFTGDIYVNSAGGNDTLTVDVNGTGLVVGQIHFDGGDGADTLTVSGTPTTPVDEVIHSMGAVTGQGRLTYENVANAALMRIVYANLEPVVDLVPAATLTVNATDADNAISYTVGSAVARGLVAIDNFETIEFSNKTALVINGAGGSDEISLNNTNTPTGLAGITVNGDDPTASDTLIVNGTTATTTVATATGTITGAGPVPITYTTIEHLTVNTGVSSTLAVTGSATYAVTPGAALNAGTVQTATLPIAFVGLDTGETLSLTGVGGADSVVANGTDADDTFTVAATTGDVTPAGRATIASTGIESLTLNGLDGDDTFNVTGAQPYTSILLAGGDPSASDVANLTGDGAVVNANNLGSASPNVTGGGLGTVSLTGVELVNLDAGAAGAILNGSAADDAAVVTSLTASGATVQVGEASPVLALSNATSMNISLGGGSDRLTVNATQGDDAVAVTGSAVTVTGLLPVNYTSEAVAVNGLGGADTITATPSATVSILVDGGDPIGVLPGDHLVLNAGGGTVAFFAGPENDEGGLQVDANKPVSFDHIESVSVSGPGPVLIVGTNGDDDITIIARDASTHAGADGVQDFTSSVNNGIEILWLDSPQICIDGLSGDDDIVFRTPAPNGAAWDVDAFVAGGPPAASDKLVLETPGASTVNYTPTGFDTGVLTLVQTPDSTITMAPFTLPAFYTSSLGGIEHLVYDGQAGGDNLTFTTLVGMQVIQLTDGPLIDAGTVEIRNGIVLGGAQLLGLTFENLGASGTLTFANTGGTRADVLTVVPRADQTSDIFSVSSTGDISLFERAAGGINVEAVLVSTPGVATLALNGLGGDDSFTVGGLTPFTSVLINGGEPGGSDSVTLVGTAADETIALDLATGIVTGLGGPITLLSVENLAIVGGGAATTDTFNVTDLGVISQTAQDLETVTLVGSGVANLIVTGTVNDDTISVRPTDDGEGSFWADNVAGPVVTYTTFAAGTFTVNGGGRFNVLHILGSEDADTVDATAPNIVNVTNGGGSAGSVTLGTDIDRLDISTFAGNDAVDLTNLTYAVPTVIDGGDGDDILIGSPNADYIKGGDGFDTLRGLAGNDTLDGGTGRDNVFGGTGNDRILVGPDSDQATWSDGDGDDVIEGGDAGTDVVVLFGSTSADVFNIDALGTRVSVNGTTNAVPFNLDMAQIERLDINGDADDDTFTVNDLDGTELRQINLNGGVGSDTFTINELDGTESRAFNIDAGAADGDADTVTYNGGTGPDNFSTSWNAAGSFIDTKIGAERVILTSTELDGEDSDTLIINGNDGNDSIKVSAPTTPGDASTGVEGHVLVVLNGGAGDDFLSADATLNGGDGNDTIVSGQGDDTIDGGDGVDRVVSAAYGNTALPFTFTLTNTSLVRTNGVLTDTDSLANIEEAELIGGTGADRFNIGAFFGVDGEWTGKVLLKGNQGSDTVDYADYEPVTLALHNTNPGVIVDLDLINTDQFVNERGSLLFLFDQMENMNGSQFKDSIFVDALAVPRLIDGNDPVFGDGYNVPPGDLLTVDGRGQFVNVNRIVGGQPQPDAGTVTAFGYRPVTFQEVEKLAITNTLSTTGLTGFDAQAYTASVPYLTDSKTPRSIATGDFNQDGWIDLVAVNSVTPGVASVLLGRGNGTFEPAVISSMGTNVKRLYDVAVVDLDGDTVLDIVTSGKNRRNQNVVLFMKGNGDGTFQTPVATVTTLKGNMLGLATGDIDGDGAVDVVITGTKQVMVLLNDNDLSGNLTTSQTILSNGKGIRSVVVEDLDHDGALDLAVANYRNSTVSVFLNDGAGAFALTGDFSTKAGKSGRVPTSMVLGDFNNDGNWDLAVSDAARNAVSVLLGDGLGSFQLQAQAKYVKPFRTIAAGDFNGDGKTDLVLGSAANFLSVLISTGNGTFSDPYDFNVGNVKRREPAGLIVADFNNDGGLDLAVADAGSNAVSVLLKNMVI